MNQQEALELVGKSGQLRTKDDWLTPVTIKEVRFSYGRLRLVVEGNGPKGLREATVEATRMTTDGADRPINWESSDNVADRQSQAAWS
jgi:hypothetical protein